eukprot:gene24231-43874_t
MALLPETVSTAGAWLPLPAAARAAAVCRAWRAALLRAEPALGWLLHQQRRPATVATVADFTADFTPHPESAALEVRAAAELGVVCAVSAAGPRCPADGDGEWAIARCEPAPGGGWHTTD